MWFADVGVEVVGKESDTGRGGEIGSGWDFALMASAAMDTGFVGMLSPFWLSKMLGWESTTMDEEEEVEEVMNDDDDDGKSNIGPPCKANVDKRHLATESDKPVKK